MANTVYCEMLTWGQEVVKIELDWASEAPAKEDIQVTGPFSTEERILYLQKTGAEIDGEIKSLSLENGLLTITFVPFPYRPGFTLKVKDQEYTKESLGEAVTKGLDRFESLEKGDVVYRLYSPEASTPRPLILFLHGGGNGAPKELRDNKKQILADYGPINLSYDYPDVYIMAPQAIERVPDEAFMKALQASTFETYNLGKHGWYREYLGYVCDIIREMIADGRVDPKRVYVTGLSMGGAGTLECMSVGSDLFAACAPICPSMYKTTYDILRTLQVPVWVSSAYIDHTLYRHKYLVDGIMQLKDEGHKNAHLTLYSPEELAKYGIGIGENVPYKKLFELNHASWVLTYHNEKGIMSWLLNQKKD